MATYRVHYSGYADVIADSEYEAIEKFEDEDFIQSEREVKDVEYLDDEDVFVVEYKDIFGGRIDG